MDERMRFVIRLHSDDAKWIVEDWMPRAMAAGLKIAASVTPAWYFGRLSVQNIQSKAPQGFVARSFNDLRQAWTWLHSVGPNRLRQSIAE